MQVLYKARKSCIKSQLPECQKNCSQMVCYTCQCFSKTNTLQGKPTVSKHIDEFSNMVSSDFV